MADYLEGGLKGLNEVWKSTKRIAMSTPEVEIKVEEATSNEEWGPTTAQMNEVAAATFRYNDLPLVIGTLLRRMQDNGRNWRHPYKSLVVIEHLLRTGSDDAARSLRHHAMEIQALSHFHYIDDQQRDVGQSVRIKAKQVLELMHDESKLREERRKARETRGKYQGYGSEAGNYRQGNYDREPAYRGDRGEDGSPAYERRRAGQPERGGGGGGDPYARGGGRNEREEYDYPSSDRGGDSYSRRGGPKPAGQSDSEDSDHEEDFNPRRYAKEPTQSASTQRVEPAAAAPPKKQLNLLDLDDPVPSQQVSSSGSGIPFGAFPPTSGGGGGGAGAGGASGLAGLDFSSSFTNQTTPPSSGQPGGDTEWDTFVSFDSAKQNGNQNDLWNKHRSLFDLQHLDDADKPKPAEEKKSIAQLLAQKKPAGGVGSTPSSTSATPVRTSFPTTLTSTIPTTTTPTTTFSMGASPYGAPASSPYGAPTSSPYGAPTTSPYGAVPPTGHYGAPTASPYSGIPTTQPGASFGFGAVPTTPAYGAQPAVGSGHFASLGAYPAARPATTTPAPTTSSGGFPF